jgi:hypothetical protein
VFGTRDRVLSWEWRQFGIGLNGVTQLQHGQSLAMDNETIWEIISLGGYLYGTLAS